MVRYAFLVKQRLQNFVAWKLKHIPRDSTEKEDALEIVVASIPIKETVFLPIYYQPTSSITTNQEIQIDETRSSWLTPIVHYLSSGKLWIARLKPTKFRSMQLDFPL